MYTFKVTLSAVVAILLATIVGTTNAAVTVNGSPMPSQNFPDPAIIRAKGKW